MLSIIYSIQCILSDSILLMYMCWFDTILAALLSVVLLFDDILMMVRSLFVTIIVLYCDYVIKY